MSPTPDDPSSPPPGLSLFILMIRLAPRSYFEGLRFRSACPAPGDWSKHLWLFGLRVRGGEQGVPTPRSPEESGMT